MFDAEAGETSAEQQARAYVRRRKKEEEPVIEPSPEQQSAPTPPPAVQQDGWGEAAQTAAPEAPPPPPPPETEVDPIIPQLDDEGDITAQVAAAPRNPSLKIQSIAELDSSIGATVSLPKNLSEAGIDLSILSSVLSPPELIMGRDGIWDHSQMLKELAAELLQEREKAEALKKDPAAADAPTISVGPDPESARGLPPQPFLAAGPPPKAPPPPAGPKPPSAK
ncbi:hypothetical protein PAPYR_6919 [Paratrimastix pyriformis]|uniref:Uncharacterized protein n=1 Tax=Paratrimastix pyriformis TaxID=342808 RepID=A0ABQ8UHA6_9EUKA|nr:hypothetical protein PAPYR_6919 [Paratrimastix pyriformis]